MKRISYLTALLFCVLMISGCGDSGSDDPTPEAATFRVDIQQSGAYEDFIQIITISGGEFHVTGTQEDMPTVLFDEHLTEENYSFEAEGVRELEIGSTTGFSPTADTPATMGLTITVYKNGKQIDQKAYTYTHETDEANETLSYKAND